MSKNQLSRMSDAYSKSLPKRDIVENDEKTFAIGFETDDISLSTRGGTASVTARISKEHFDKIVYSYGAYILDYFKEKRLIK